MKQRVITRKRGNRINCLPRENSEEGVGVCVRIFEFSELYPRKSCSFDKLHLCCDPNALENPVDATFHRVRIQRVRLTKSFPWPLVLVSQPVSNSSDSS
ncbi:hypothetical protein AVEN_268438-1 [Araneus ventricosus]|uniref:Uncharacterized protein n=1 Tax=Araneus ventricosus TaxID=182803 RepID=A0A4Y2JHM0_ARAVE|nr:hypothetical protein AVEN_268438-1 [Araneus ventricosus]